MQSDDTRNQLIHATKELLLTVQNPEKITARQIASKANVNLAMINYCFGSKDELLKKTILLRKKNLKCFFTMYQK